MRYLDRQAQELSHRNEQLRNTQNRKLEQLERLRRKMEQERRSTGRPHPKTQQQYEEASRKLKRLQDSQRQTSAAAGRRVTEAKVGERVAAAAGDEGDGTSMTGAGHALATEVTMDGILARRRTLLTFQVRALC